MLHEFEDFANRILNAEDYDVINQTENSVSLIFTSDNFEVNFSRIESGGETIYLFSHNGSLPHRIGYYRDYEEWEVANDLSDAFLIGEIF